MAVYSMTGYGSASQGAPSVGVDAPPTGSVTVDIRSVNGRFLDLALRRTSCAAWSRPCAN
jgi:uncharacterized protein YicC (UPF0701 family)